MASLKPRSGLLPLLPILWEKIEIRGPSASVEPYEIDMPPPSPYPLPP